MEKNLPADILKLAEAAVMSSVRTRWCAQLYPAQAAGRFIRALYHQHSGLPDAEGAVFDHIKDKAARVLQRLGNWRQRKCIR